MSSTNSAHLLTAKDGDIQINWSPDNENEVATAQKFYDEQIAKGMIAYETTTNGKKKAARLSSFDPTAERIVFVPKVEGGYPQPFHA